MLQAINPQIQLGKKDKGEEKETEKKGGKGKNPILPDH